MKLVIRWAPAIVCMAIIFYLSAQTGDDLGSLLPYFQKWIPALESFDIGHFFAYFVLALTFFWAMLPFSIHPLGKVTVVVLCVLYGLSDEYHQSFIPGRMSDIKDIRNDAIGAIIAVLVVSLPVLNKRIRKRFLS
ncbi:MAG: VanZ-like protein [Paenibacillus sp.]|nr:VanZ-like protein [Paenibacillus sp.]